VEDLGEIVGEFLMESHENLDQIDRDLVSLEQEPDSRDLISRIFRAIHTIKGTSGFLAFSRLEKLAHAGESLLSKLRDGVMPVTPSTITDATEKAKFLVDWHTSLPVQAAMARFIESGAFARHIRKVGAAYRRRHAMVTRGVSTLLHEHLELVPSNAGLHVTAVARRLNATHMQEVIDSARTAGVAVQSLARFGMAKRRRVGVVLGYGSIPAERIEEGLRRLRSCFGPK